MTDDEYDPDETLENRLWPARDAERAYIAAVLHHEAPNELLWRSSLLPMHLGSTHLATVLETMLTLRDRRVPVHFLTVAEELAGTDAEIAMWQATNEWANPMMVEFFAEQVMARYKRRAVAGLGDALSDVAETVPGTELDATVQRAVNSVLTTQVVADVTTTDRTLRTRAFGARDLQEQIPTPFPRLNKAIKGFRRGQLYTLSGDTGSGKSAVALQMAYALAQRGTCLYCSMEMAEDEQQDRLIAQQTGVTLDFVERQHFPGVLAERVERFVNRVTSIVFDDRPNLSVTDIRRRAMGVPRLTSIVVDQLALMDLQRQRGENLADAIARTTAQLKVMASELDVPVLLLSQLNREAVRAGRPTRHHLYGSSGIANDSGVILILHREDPTHPEHLTLIVDKNRQGSEGELELSWEGASVRAVDPTGVSDLAN